MAERNDILNHGTYASLGQLQEKRIAPKEWDNHDGSSLADRQGKRHSENLVDSRGIQQTIPQATEAHPNDLTRDHGSNWHLSLQYQNCESIASQAKEQRNMISPQTDLLTPAAVSTQN